MAEFPGLTLWTDAWIADTKHLTRCERGTYMDLLILMWRTPGCSVPNDDEWLAKYLGMTPEEIKNELRPIISEFCQSDGNRLTQKRLLSEFVRSKKRQASGSAAAKALWRLKKASRENRGQRITTLTTNTYKNLSSSSSESRPAREKIPEIPKKEKREFKNMEDGSGNQAGQLPPEARPSQSRPKLANGKPWPPSPIRPPPPTGLKPKRQAARAAWEADLGRCLGLEDYGTAIGLLAADAALCDRATDAELRKPGSGAMAALLALRTHPQ